MAVVDSLDSPSMSLSILQSGQAHFCSQTIAIRCTWTKATTVSIHCNYTQRDRHWSCSSCFQSCAARPVVVYGHQGDITYDIRARSTGVNLPPPHPPLLLINVPHASNLIKNLVSIRKFITDNQVSVKFDPFGFSVNDFQAGMALMRCNSQV